ncbi:MAG: winged helix-turn-helix transcriptional regulator [candidate division SR1 bacterium]|nr:winged helix-turn-helix transcriptional regulator [candidate division SR1 bacterium]
MTKQSLINENNMSVALAANIIGDTWSLQIIKELIENKKLRFSEIQDLVANICPRTLSQRLEKLKSQGIISKNIVDARPIYCEYTLTNLGEKTSPIIQAMAAFNHSLKKEITR